MPGKTPNSTALRTGSSSAGTRRRLPKCWPSEASGRTSLCWTRPGRCSPELVETVAQFGPRRVVYVSCDPATLARDLKLFAQLGYPPVEAAPVDMFPGTAHVETVVLMSRVKD